MGLQIIVTKPFFVSQWTCSYVKEIIDVQATQIKKCTLCDTILCSFDVSSSFSNNI
jgi:hypothetical protein